MPKVNLHGSSQSLPWLVLVLSAVVSFGVWHWADTIFLPANTVAAIVASRPMGNNSDLYARWLGSRAVLLYHRNPYSDQVTREIQTGFYGRPLDPRRPADPPFQESFVYPLYVVFLLAPTVTTPFPTVQAVFRWLLLLSVAGSVPLWLQAVGFRTQRLYVLSAMLLASSTYAAVLEFHMQNLAALVIFLLAAAGALLVRNYQTLAGFCLALATIKPEVSWLMVAWFLLWAIATYSEGKRLLWSFLGTMLGLIVAAEALLPHWMTSFFAAVREYPTYGTEPNIFQIFLPSLSAEFAMAVSVILMIAYCWRWKRAVPGSLEFGWALAWAAVVTLALLPKLSAYNQPILIPALAVLIPQQETAVGLFARALRKGAFACQIWQWLAALGLSVCSLFVPAAHLFRVSQWPLFTFIALIPVTLLAIMFGTVSRWGIAGSKPRQDRKFSNY